MSSHSVTNKSTLVDFAQNIHILGYPKLDINIYQPIKHFISINVTCIDFPAFTILFILVQFIIFSIVFSFIYFLK